MSSMPTLPKPNSLRVRKANLWEWIDAKNCWDGIEPTTKPTNCSQAIEIVAVKFQASTVKFYNFTWFAFLSAQNRAYHDACLFVLNYGSVVRQMTIRLLNNASRCWIPIRTFNIEVKQLWVRTVLVWKIARAPLVLLAWVWIVMLVNSDKSCQLPIEMYCAGVTGIESPSCPTINARRR